MHKYDTLANLFLYIFAVALYTSAWIEIAQMDENAICVQRSHSARVYGLRFMHVVI